MRNADINLLKWNTIKSNFLLFRVPFHLFRSWNKSYVPEWNGELSSVWKNVPEQRISCSVPVCSIPEQRSRNKALTKTFWSFTHQSVVIFVKGFDHRDHRSYGENYRFWIRFYSTIDKLTIIELWLKWEMEFLFSWSTRMFCLCLFQHYFL